MIIFCKTPDVLFLPVVFIVQIPMLKGSHFLVQIHLYRPESLSNYAGTKYTNSSNE